MEELLELGFWRTLLREALNWLINSGPSILVILLLALIGLRVLRFGVARLQALMMRRGGARAATNEEYAKRVTTLTGILHKIAKSILWLIVLTLLLRELGVDVAPLIAGAGIVGLAVGFGAQNLVRDLIGGFFLILENQIRTGDVAIINGTGGLVEAINLRTTVLRDLSGVVHVFPNGAVASLSNMTKEWSAIVLDIGVAYKEDTDQVAEVMRAVSEELREDPEFRNKILEPIEIFGVDAFGDSAVVLKARIKTHPIQQWAVGREYRRRLKKAFDAQGIEIPFPHRTLYFGEASKPIDVQVLKAAAGS
ncbi:MAG: mechanosensitive ion channel family protein [Candidatus Latescibacterota bacterium]|nr:MAG: mechanosensitive ion channel family protein [Candidatus Latescibacterota bacterium]